MSCGWEADGQDEKFSFRSDKINPSNKYFSGDIYPESAWIGCEEDEEEIDYDVASQDAESPDEDNEEVNKDENYQDEEYQAYEEVSGW